VHAPCFVLGLFDTGLAVVRALGRAGLPVFGFDHQPEFGFRSRYGTHAVCPDPRTSATQLLAFLQARARPLSSKPILYPTSDSFVAFMSDHREGLDQYFRYALPSPEAVSAGIDKASQYEHAARAGVPIPSTHTPRTLEDVRALAERLEYPVVVKPVVGHVWRERFRSEKAVRVDDAATLVALFEQIFNAALCAVVQAQVAGGNDNHYKVSAYFDQGGAARAVICMRKIRQFPVDFGVGTLMESVVEPDLRELGLRFFRSLGWRGPGSIEFKRDDRDGQWKLIELNPRLWQQHALAASCGLNFPLVQYQDLTGQSGPCESYTCGVRWLDEFRDPRSAWEHWKGNRMRFREWARSLRRVRSFALWAPDDPAPFLASARHHGARAWHHVRAQR
jgi:predicted ATP-grasp superfamily ATP-dependent carboligase